MSDETIPSKLYFFKPKDFSEIYYGVDFVNEVARVANEKLKRQGKWIYANFGGFLGWNVHKQPNDDTSGFLLFTEKIEQCTHPSHMVTKHTKPAGLSSGNDWYECICGKRMLPETFREA